MGLMLFFQGPTAPPHTGSTVENKVDDSTERALYSKPHEPSEIPREDPLMGHETKMSGAKGSAGNRFSPNPGAEAVNEMLVASLGRNGGTCRTQIHRDCLFVCRYLRAALYLL